MEFLFDDILLPCFSNVPQGDGGDGPRAEAWLQGVETMSLESALSLPTPNLLVKGMDGYDADILAGIPQDQDGPKGHVEVYVYSELRHICQKQRQRPELLQAGAKRRRLAGKQPRSVHDACVMLLDHCTGRKRCAAVSHNQLRLGCSELVRNLARSKGMSYRQARPECSAAWSNAPAALRVAWFLVYQLRQALKVTYRDDAWDTGDPFRPPAGDSAECYGILVTWHTNIGTADPEIRLLEGSKLEEQQLVTARTGSANKGGALAGPMGAPMLGGVRAHRRDALSRCRPRGAHTVPDAWSHARRYRLCTARCVRRTSATDVHATAELSDLNRDRMIDLLHTDPQSAPTSQSQIPWRRTGSSIAARALQRTSDPRTALRRRPREATRSARHGKRGCKRHGCQ